MNDFVFVIAAPVVVIVILYSSIRIAQEDERFAVFTLGRFAGFKGPGLFLAAFAINKFHRLKIGDVGVLTGSAFAKFGDADIPVSISADIHVGQAVRIDRFNGAEPVIATATGPSAPIRAPFDET
jgi:hypothetical protein